MAQRSAAQRFPVQIVLHRIAVSARESCSAANSRAHAALVFFSIAIPLGLPACLSASSATSGAPTASTTRSKPTCRTSSTRSVCWVRKRAGRNLAMARVRKTKPSCWIGRCRHQRRAHCLSASLCDLSVRPVSVPADIKVKEQSFENMAK